MYQLDVMDKGLMLLLLIFIFWSISIYFQIVTQKLAVIDATFHENLSSSVLTSHDVNYYNI